MKHIKQEKINQNDIIEDKDYPLNSKDQKIDTLNNNQNPKLDNKNIIRNIKK